MLADEGLALVFPARLMHGARHAQRTALLGGRLISSGVPSTSSPPQQITLRASVDYLARNWTAEGVLLSGAQLPPVASATTIEPALCCQEGCPAKMDGSTRLCIKVVTNVCAPGQRDEPPFPTEHPAQKHSAGSVGVAEATDGSCAPDSDTPTAV